MTTTLSPPRRPPPVLLIFIGGVLIALPVVVISAVVAWDVWLAGQAPDGVWTISWQMALLGRYPIAVWFLGLWCGFVAGCGLVALPAHFWFGMMPPAEWDELVALRAEKAARDLEMASKVTQDEEVIS